MRLRVVVVMAALVVSGTAAGAMAAGTAYFGSLNGRLYAVDVNTGDIQWCYQAEASKKNEADVLTVDGRVRSSFWPEDMTSYSKFLGAVDRIISVGSVLSSPAVADGVVYFGSMDGSVYAVE